MKIKRFSLNLRFSLTIGAILLVFSAMLSILLYSYLKAQVIRDAEEKTMILMTQVEAIGGYVSETLRPKMFEILSRTHSVDNFIIEPCNRNNCGKWVQAMS